MKRTVSLKLATTPEQAQALSVLQTEFANACNAVVPLARDNRCWNRVALHHLAYYKLRGASALGSQMVCNAIKAVADSYKVLKLRKTDDVPMITFKPTGSVHLDARTFWLKGTTVSLYTLEGRIQVKLALGEFQTAYLAAGKPKEAELIRKGRQWFLNLVLDLPDAACVSGGSLGVDIGENTLAAISTGKVWGGGKLRHVRDGYLAHRRRLQSNGSRAAKRKLHAISGREQRHVKHINHETSKAIVVQAIRAGAGEIRLEDLTHIRARIKAGKRVRARLHRWAFRQLQSFVAYKAEAAGLRVVYVDPAYTSQTCSVCGAIGQRVKHRFACSCGNRSHADVNASRNIERFAEPIGSARVAVTRPKFAHKVSPCVVESRPL